MVRILSTVVLLLGTAFAQYVPKTLYPAVVLLYEQDDQGSMKMLCTATAIEKNKTGYVFVTAAHCASTDNEEKKLVKAETKKFFFVTLDETGSKNFIKASLQNCGYQHAGDDFCQFQVDTDKTIPTVDLGSDPASGGEEIVNVASPLGLGKQVFKGYISSPKLDRDIRVEDINWTNAILLQLPGTNGGSSGSAIVCTEQKAICAFLVGTIADTEIVAIPVSRFKAFRTATAAGTYKYKQEDP
jgi:hypothetical protein